VRVLIVSCWYAPREHPRALRWSAIAREWAARGARVTVLCAAGAGLPPEEIVAGVQVVRVGRGPAAATGGAGETPRATARLARGTWRALRWPDWACRWYLPARRTARALLAAAPYDRLVSVSDPFTSHLVALAARRAQPRLPWLVDIGDPFSLQEQTPVNNPWLYRGLNRRAEARVLAAASAAAVTVPSLRARYAAAFPAAAPKFAVIPPLYAPPPGGADVTVFPADGRLRLLWVGTLYRAVRDPRPLFALARRLLAGPLGARLELHLMGDAGDCRDLVAAAVRELRGRLVAHGVVPRSTALAAARQAGCLVNIGNATGHQLPSKLAEYAASGRPILNLEGSDADTSREFLAGHPACLSLPAGAAATQPGAARVEQFLRDLPVPDPALLASWLEPCTAPRVAAAYDALFEAAAPAPIS
jgi:hypothetical protein